jgi:hypothetical protein
MLWNNYKIVLKWQSMHIKQIKDIVGGHQTLANYIVGKRHNLFS